MLLYGARGATQRGRTIDEEDQGDHRQEGCGGTPEHTATRRYHLRILQRVNLYRLLRQPPRGRSRVADANFNLGVCGPVTLSPREATEGAQGQGGALRQDAAPFWFGYSADASLVAFEP